MKACHGGDRVRAWHWGDGARVWHREMGRGHGKRDMGEDLALGRWGEGVGGGDRVRAWHRGDRVRVRVGKMERMLDTLEQHASCTRTYMFGGRTLSCRSRRHWTHTDFTHAPAPCVRMCVRVQTHTFFLARTEDLP